MLSLNSNFDKYQYYQDAVQSPDEDCEFLIQTYSDLRGYSPRILREDFCGTFTLCCRWVRRGPEFRAIAVDIDPEPLDYGRQTEYQNLSGQQQQCIEIINKCVLSEG